MSKRTASTESEQERKKKKAESGAAAAASASCAHSTPLPVLAAKASSLHYLTGFGCHHESEALPDALPVGQNSPQVCPYGLFAEQLSGTSFTTPRHENQRSWLYRIRPSVGHPPFTAVASASSSSSPSLASELVVGDFSNAHISPTQYRWKPFPMPGSDSNGKSGSAASASASASASSATVDFVQGLASLAGHGSPDSKSGLAIHVYTCNTSMVDKSFVNSDGDFLIVPQHGTLHVRTEFGMMVVSPGHICVVQRGMHMSIGVEGASRGYICEVYNGHFRLPELGPIGANALANPRDFQQPTAAFEDRKTNFTVVQKYIGKFFTYTRPYSPYDVVAWHGNYVPYMYDLNKFCPLGAVRFDHIDPSIFTVLTCPGPDVGVASADFVIFPPRWAVQEHTFRPPYYHRNVMSEFMGNICGKYEAKPDGFMPGGASLHSCMAAHGPDAATFKAATTELQKPVRLSDDSLAFMFETAYMLKLTDYALKIAQPDEDYWKVWEPIQSQFDPNWKKTNTNSSK